MADTLLITDADLIKGSPLGGNIDIDKYRSVIRETQIFVIEPILGTKLYNKLQADYLADTLAGDYATLMTEYVQPIIIYSVAAEYITISGFTISNAGAFRRTPSDTQPMSKEEIDYLANKQRGKSDVYIERMQRFLADTNISEYDAVQDENYDVRPDRDVSTFGGWRLSKSYPISSAEKEIWKDIWYDEGR